MPPPSLTSGLAGRSLRRRSPGGRLPAAMVGPSASLQRPPAWPQPGHSLASPARLAAATDPHAPRPASTYPAAVISRIVFPSGKAPHSQLYFPPEHTLIQQISIAFPSKTHILPTPTAIGHKRSCGAAARARPRMSPGRGWPVATCGRPAAAFGLPAAGDTRPLPILTGAGQPPPALPIPVQTAPVQAWPPTASSD